MEPIAILEQYFRELPPFVLEHSERVGVYARITAAYIAKCQKDIQLVGLEPPVHPDTHLFGRYHDIGKTGIADEVLNSSGLFDSQCRNLMHAHTIIGGYLVQHKLNLPQSHPDRPALFDVIADCCLYHHERWYGCGYPFGLQGSEIPFYARLIAIADSYDAMTADRPYHTGISKEQALQEIHSQAGKQFDPILAPLFCKVIGNAAVRK